MYTQNSIPLDTNLAYFVQYSIDYKNEFFNFFTIMNVTVASFNTLISMQAFLVWNFFHQEDIYCKLSIRHYVLNFIDSGWNYTGNACMPLLYLNLFTRQFTLKIDGIVMESPISSIMAKPNHAQFRI